MAIKLVVGVAAAVRRHAPSSLLQPGRTPAGAPGNATGTFCPLTRQNPLDPGRKTRRWRS
jgi:hypothetical protein